MGKTFGDWLQDELNSRGWIQADLVRVSGIPTPTVSRLVNGRQRCGESSARKIAKAFDYTADTVMRVARGLPPSTRIEDRPIVQRVFQAGQDLPDNEWEELLATVLAKREKLRKLNTGAGLQASE